MVKNLIKRGQLLLTAAVLASTLLSTAVLSIANTQKAAAATPDKVNIVYKGLSGSNTSEYVSSFKNYYNTNKSGHKDSPSVKKDYTDLQAVYNWAGASKSIVSGMNTTNTKVGTLYKDGHITVDGATVATGSSVTARFNGGKGFSHVTSNIYARKTTTSFDRSSAKVIVYMSNGKMVFAIMVDCGNAVKGTPKEQPKPPVALTCDELVFNSKGSDNKSFTFSAKATPKNTTITDYVFAFGDGQTKTVTTSASVAKTDHSYAKEGTYTATVKVNSKDKKNVTSSNCAVKITIAPPEAVVTCDQLTFSKKDKDSYSFTAKAAAKNTVITDYVFDFGDGQKKTVTTGNTTAAADHDYAKAGTYTAYVTVNSKDKKNVTSAKCAVKIEIAQEMCPVPGKEHLPVDSPECKETPVTPVISCDQLVISPNGSNKLAYSFVVKATAQNATITGYTVDFGDGTTPYTGSANAVNHTYAKAGTYTAKASVTATANGKSQTVTSAACAGPVTIVQPMCDVPGKQHLPVDSPDCKETPEIPVTPETPETPVTPEAPLELPKTGPASIAGLFIGFSIAGASLHRLFSRRSES
jgi:PKD repeat protein